MEEEKVRPPEDAHPFDRLDKLVALLRDPRGCPWDRAQTLDTMKPHLIEEAYEAAEAIEAGDDAALAEELGDLLFLVFFLGKLLGERTGITAGHLARGITDKMIARHPHVFEDAPASSPEDVVVHWERTKSKERGSERGSVLDGLPRTLPALQRAHRLQERAGGLGFDWPAAEPVLEKVREEMRELEEALGRGNASDARVREEIGDLLFSVVNLSRKLGMNAEEALRQSCEKFRTRFGAVEDGIRAAGRPLSLEEMDRLWEAAKGAE